MERTTVPPQYRRRKRNGLGCTCDCNYARSLQGICKVIQLVLLGMAWIIIAASPYWRPIFVIGGETWPFHIVMLLSILTWLAVLILYCLFMSGYHLSQGHRNWPKFEFYFNVGAAILILIAACLEAANVWRWDMMNGNVLSGGGSYSRYYQYGLRPGMSFTQTLNFNTYCAQRPYDCSDYFNLLAGNNSYYTNHLFAVVLLFFALISFLVSSFFAYRTWRIFERDMYKPGELPKPTMWMRFTYQMEKAANHVRERASKAVPAFARRDNEEDDDEEDDVVIEEVKKTKSPALDVEAGFGEERSHKSDGRSSRARSHSLHHTSHSHHGSHRPKSRSSHYSSSHRRDENGRSSRHEGSEKSSRHHGRSSRSSSDHHSRSDSKPKSTSPLYEVPPPYEEKPLVHSQPVGSFPSLKSKKGSKKDKKGEPPVDLSPVASVMI